MPPTLARPARGSGPWPDPPQALTTDQGICRPDCCRRIRRGPLTSCTPSWPRCAGPWTTWSTGSSSSPSDA